MSSFSSLLTERPDQLVVSEKTPGLLRLPLFGVSLILYGLGMLLSAWIANGNPLRVFWLVVGFLLFWPVVMIGRKTAYLYYLGLGSTGFMMVVGGLAAANLDDDYLRNNAISVKIMEVAQLVSPRLPGLQMHRNTLAGVLAIFGVLALSYGLFARQGWVRWLGRANCLLMLAILLLTNSRGGLTAFVVGGVLLVGLSWPGSSRRRRVVITVWGFGLLALTGWYLVASGQYQLFTPERLLNENGIGRLEIWKNTLYMLGDVPLTGFGPGNFRAVYPFYIDPSLASGRASQEHAHNLFLQIYGEAGILGLLGIVGVFGRLVAVFWKTFRQRIVFAASPGAAQNERAILVGWAGLAASATMFFYALTEFNPWNEQFTFLFWFPPALVAAVYRPTAPEKPRLKPLQLLQRYKDSSGVVKLGVSLGTGLVVAVAVWQLWGLALVNLAGVTGQRVWLGTGNGQLDVIENYYHAAESSVGWTGVPRRGEAWVAWQKQDNAKAEDLYRQVLRNDPDDRRSLLVLGDIIAARSKAEALPYWRKAGAATLYINRGRRLYDRDDDLGSEPFFLTALDIDPRLWDGYHLLVSLYQRHSRTADAIALLEKAQQFLPGDPRIQAELAGLKPAS